MRGLYVHVPFCLSKCAYCDFYSVTGSLELVPAWVDAVLEEARRRPGLCFETLYLGGGTPSLLDAVSLRRLVEGLRQSFDLTRLAEATVEANPESASEEWLRAVLALGFHRVSIGVQSLSDRELSSVGRAHSARQGAEAVSRALEAGFHDVSADLIVGLPGGARPQTALSGDGGCPKPSLALERTLEHLVTMGVSHFSLYCLCLEPGTRLARRPPADLPDDDAQADLFEGACSALEQRGFIHYEISNLCLPGRECRHNVNYWRGGEYLGLGPGAASHLGGRRWRNRADLPGYLRGPGAAVEDVEQLGAKAKAAEEAMLRLRLLVEGLSAEEMVERFGEEPMRDVRSRLDQMADGGLLIRDGRRYRLAPGRALTSNSILGRVLD